jgi:FkbM family methyltransferase
VGFFRKQIKDLIENLSGYEIERFGHRSFALINRKLRADAWFSYHAQLRSIIEKYDINCFLDVGANEGQFAKELRSLYREKIVSFEPVTIAFEKLAAVAASDPKWQVYKLALGSQTITRTINVSDHTVFSSLFRANDYCVQHFGGQVLRKKEEVVSIQRLDEIMDKIVPDIENSRIFLKMDTQGYDTEVFRGLGKKLKHVIALQSEVSLISIYEGMPHWTDIIPIYEEAGYRVVGMFPVNRDSDKIIECDCLLVRVK